MKTTLAVIGGVTVFWLTGMVIGLCLRLWNTRDPS